MHHITVYSTGSLRNPHGNTNWPQQLRENSFKGLNRMSPHDTCLVLTEMYPTLDIIIVHTLRQYWPSKFYLKRIQQYQESQDETHYSPATRTTCLPMLRPSKSPMRADGAFSIPSTMSSTYTSFPSLMY